jgi:hypothetical protein
MLLSGHPSVRTGRTRLAPDLPYTVHLCVSRLARSHRTRLALCTVRATSTSLHWVVASIRAHIATICFLRFRCLLYSECCKSRFGIAYVAIVIHVCFKCRFEMFRLFHTYMLSVLSGCCICCSGLHVCCKCMFQMFHLF